MKLALYGQKKEKNMLYENFKGRFSHAVVLFSDDPRTKEKLYREAQNYKTKIRVVSFGKLYRVDIINSLLKFKFNAWKFHRRIEKMKSLRLKGWTYKEIGLKFGKSKQDIHYLVNKRG